MNPASFLDSLHNALDAIVERDFDFTSAESLLPSGRLLSIEERLEILRQLDLDRPEFAKKVDLINEELGDLPE